MKLSRLFLGAALLLTAISANAQYPRKILVEQFTTEFTAQCFNINSISDPFLASKIPNVIPLKIHGNVNDSKLAVGSLENYYRDFLYYIQAHRLIFPGDFAVNGSMVEIENNMTVSDYVQKMTKAVQYYENLDSPIKLTVLEDRTTSPDKIEVSVVVETSVELQDNVNIFMNMNEDNIPNSKVGGTNGETNFRWVSRGFFPQSNLGLLTKIKKGMSGFYFTVPVKSEWNLSNLKSIAWLQNANTNEVLQAEVTSKPAKEEAVIATDSTSLFFDKSTAKSKKDVGLQNRGYGYMTISKIELVGQDADKFSLVYNPTITRLHPAERLPLRVSIINPVKGSLSTKLVITTNAVNNPVLEIPINSVIDGDLLYPEIKASQNKIEFGDITTFVDKTIAFTNTGNATLEIARADLLSKEDTVNFKILSGPFPDRLEVGQRFDMKIRFIPTNDESFYSNFSVYSNAQTNPTLSIDMTGAGKNVVPFADFQVLNDSLKFGLATSKQTKKINIYNLGTEELKISDVEVLNDSKQMFKLETERKVNVPQYGNTEIAVSFTPKETGTFDAQLLVTSNATKPNNFKKFYLSGAADMTSIKEEPVSNELGISLSPSPTDNFLNISLKEAAKADFVRIYSSTGELIKEMKDFMISNNQNSISVSDLSSGAYVVLVSANGKLSQEKFTIKR